MSTYERELSPREHNEMRDLVLAGTQHIRPAGAHRAQFVAIGVSLVLVGAVTGGILTASLRDDGAPPPVATPTPNPVTLRGDGWIAYNSYGPEEDIYFVKEGSAPHRVLESDGEPRGQVCPAFSPDGTRLASGQGGYGQQGPQEGGALVISDLTADGEVAASEVIPLDGLRQQPCPIWSPDRQWVAFGVGLRFVGSRAVADEVWVVGPESGEIRKLPGLAVTDIEWAADSSQLYIADDGIRAYSMADDQSRVFDDTEGAVAVTASPDGASIAVERRRSTSTVIPEQYDMWVMSVDGADRRLLVEDYAHDIGIGPVWSPDGNRIVFQGGADVPTIVLGGQTYNLGQNDEIVMVTVGENDPLGPVGTQTVLAPIETTEGGESRHWFPTAVSWSPDSTALRVVGVELPASGGESLTSALLIVPIDAAGAATILWEGPAAGPAMSIPQNDFQSWGAG